MTHKISYKIDNVVHMPIAWACESPPPPHSVKIELMRTCNYRCAFCYHSRLKKMDGRMDWSLYQKILKELKAIGVEEVAPFFFGESFLDSRLPSAIQLAKQEGFKYVFLTTNGSVATTHKVDLCMRAGLDSLKFSLNSASEQQFESVTGVSGKLFHTVIANIKKARVVRDEGGYDCGLYASYIMFDGEQGERMDKVVKELAPFLDEIYTLPLYNQAATITQEGWELTGGNTGRLENPVPNLPCWVLFREGHINFDGTVCACSFSVSDDFIMGDLTKQSFMEIWHSDHFRRLRQAHLDKNITGTVCDGCIIKK